MNYEIIDFHTKPLCRSGNVFARYLFIIYPKFVFIWFNCIAYTEK